MLTSKKHSLALVILVLTSTIGYADVTLPKKPIQKPATFIINKRDKARKRDVSILRALWNDLKCGLGITSTVAGSLGIANAALAYVHGSIIYLNINHLEILKKNISPWTATGILAGSAGLVYLGYKVIQNSFTSMRNEYVESYFGITKPDQIQYRGETTE